MPCHAMWCHVCVCAWMCACMCSLCVLCALRAGEHAWLEHICVCVRASVRPCVYAYMRVCARVCLRVCMRVFVRVRMRVCMLCACIPSTGANDGFACLHSHCSRLLASFSREPSIVGASLSLASPSLNTASTFSVECCVSVNSTCQQARAPCFLRVCKVGHCGKKRVPASHTRPPRF